jgi:hypothetical protein
MTDLFLPYVPQSVGDGPQGRFSAIRSTFHKGSNSESSQSTTTKDNSAIVEDEALAASDASQAAKDDATVVSFRGGDDGSRTVDLSTQTEDNSGRIEVGNQNDIKIESVDPEIVADAFGFGESALSEVGETTDTLADALNSAFGFAQISQQAANDLSRVTNETLASKSSDADSAVSETLQKNILIGTGIIAAAIVISQMQQNG